jgi:DNA-binding transcriptional MerR regulator
VATATSDLERESGDRRGRPLTIGAVCRQLQSDYPDISISKIRYLEDQGLLNLRRTQGGYRLFTEEDVDRLETILRLQRDEFLPLRVIRQELASPMRAREGKRLARNGLRVPQEEVDFGTLCARSGASREFVRDLEDYGLLEPRVEDAMSTSSKPACGSRATASSRATCGASGPGRTARPGSWSRSWHRRSAPTSPSGGRPASRISRRSPRCRRSSRNSCSGALCALSSPDSLPRWT